MAFGNGRRYRGRNIDDVFQWVNGRFYRMTCITGAAPALETNATVAAVLARLNGRYIA
jgi:hypothetical protein